MSQLYTYDREVARLLSVTVEETALSPVTSDEAKLYARVDTVDEDSVFDILIKSALKGFESYTGKLMFERTVTALFDSEGYGTLILPYVPVASVTSVQDDDSEDIDYELKGDRIHVNEDGEVTVIYESGLFETVNDMTDDVKLGILKYIVSNYEDRQDIAALNIHELPNGSKNEWNRYRNYSI